MVTSLKVQWSNDLFTWTDVVGSPFTLSDAPPPPPPPPTSQGKMIDVTTRGLIADNATDNSPALNALIASLPASGGVLLFPAGSYKFNSTVLINKSSITLMGEGAYGSTALWWAGSGASNFIDILSVQYSRLQDLTIRSGTTGQTGFLVTVRDGGGSSPSGTSFINVNFSPSAGGFGLSLNTSLSNYLENCRFSGGYGGIMGRANPAGYSNGFIMNGGQFVGQAGAPIYLGGVSWQFNGVVFEARADGKGVAYVGDSSVPAYGVAFNDCWFGDAAAADGHSWIDFTGYGLNVRGGFISGTTGANTGITLRGVKGFAITGVVFDQLSAGIDYAAAGCKGGLVSGNSYTAVANFETNTANKDSSVINTGNAAF